MAQRSGLPLQEMFIEMSSPYLGKHWPLFKPPVLPLHIRIVPGQQLDPAGQTPNAVAAQFKADVRAHFALPHLKCPAAMTDLPHGAPMPFASRTHGAHLPSYNPGSKVPQTVLTARSSGARGGGDRQQHRQQPYAALALADGLRVARAAAAKALPCFTACNRPPARLRMLTMDSDGLLITSSRPLRASARPPEAIVLSPTGIRCHYWLRQWPKVSNFWANLETLWHGIGDSLYGFRIYMALVHLVRSRWMRR